MPSKPHRSPDEPLFAPRTESLTSVAPVADDPLARLPAPRNRQPREQPDRIHKTFVLFRDTADTLAEQATAYRLGIGEFTDFLLRSALAAVADGTLTVPTHAVPFQPPNYRQGGTRRLPVQALTPADEEPV